MKRGRVAIGHAREPNAFTGVRTPICGHYARIDDWADLATVHAVQANVRASGGRMDVHVYDAPHGFLRSTDASTYDPTSAALAWERTLAFLRECLE